MGMRAGVLFWQETIDLKKGSNKGHMRTRSEGVLFSGLYQIRSGPTRWMQAYTADLGIGQLRGKGATNAIPDELKGQYWALLGGSAGLTYRSSPVSEVGLSLPVYFRVIKWKLQSGSQLDPEKDNSFSVGLRGHFAFHFDGGSALVMAITHHHLWRASIWEAGWQTSF